MLSYNCCYSAALFLYIAIIKSSPATITMTLFIKGNILFCQKSMLTVIRGLNRYGSVSYTHLIYSRISQLYNMGLDAFSKRRTDNFKKMSNLHKEILDLISKCRDEHVHRLGSQVYLSLIHI